MAAQLQRSLRTSEDQPRTQVLDAVKMVCDPVRGEVSSFRRYLDQHSPWAPKGHLSTDRARADLQRLLSNNLQ